MLHPLNHHADLANGEFFQRLLRGSRFEGFSGDVAHQSAESGQSGGLAPVGFEDAHYGAVDRSAGTQELGSGKDGREAGRFFRFSGAGIRNAGSGNFGAVGAGDLWGNAFGNWTGQRRRSWRRNEHHGVRRPSSGRLVNACGGRGIDLRRRRRPASRGRSGS